MAVVVSCDRDYFVLYSIYQKLQMLPQALIAVDWLTGWWMIPSFLCAWAKISVWLVLVLLLLLFCFFFYFTTNFSLVARCFFCSHRNRLRFVLVFWQIFYHSDCVCMEQIAVYAFSWRWSGCDLAVIMVNSFALSRFPSLSLARIECTPLNFMSSKFGVIKRNQKNFIHRHKYMPHSSFYSAIARVLVNL